MLCYSLVVSCYKGGYWANQVKCKVLKCSLTIACLHFLVALYDFSPFGSHLPRNEVHCWVSTPHYKNSSRSWASKFMCTDWSIKCNERNHGSSPEMAFFFSKGLSTYFAARWSIKNSNIYIELSGGGEVRCSFNSILTHTAIQQGIHTSCCSVTNKIILFSRMRLDLK